MDNYLQGEIKIYEVTSKQLITQFNLGGKNLSKFAGSKSFLSEHYITTYYYIDDLPTEDYFIRFNLYNKTKQFIDYAVGCKKKTINKIRKL